MATGERLVATNRKARHEFFIEETYEAGLMLTGTEVKSLRGGRASIQESFARVEDGELWVYHMHIPPYEAGNIFNHDPLRPRKLLLHRREVDRLYGRVQQKGYTLIPLRVYFRRGIAKLELGVARGKRQYDKRAAIAEREADRRIERAVRQRRR
ncbi:MAG: SsrA-binding protein SmpB [bacterium]